MVVVGDNYLPAHGTITRRVKLRCRCRACETTWRRYQDQLYADHDPAGFGTDAQDRFLEQVTAGSTLKAAAAACGVSSSTVSILARSRPEFRHRLDTALDISRPRRHQGRRPSTRRTIATRRSRPWVADAGYDTPDAAIRATATMTQADAAKALKISVATVVSWRRRLGMTSTHRWWTDAGYDTREEAIRDTAAMPLADAAKALKISVALVSDRRHRLGLEITNRKWVPTGYDTTEEAIRDTATMPLTEAATMLGASPTTIHKWRKRILSTPDM